MAISLLHQTQGQEVVDFLCLKPGLQTQNISIASAMVIVQTILSSSRREERGIWLLPLPGRRGARTSAYRDFSEKLSGFAGNREKITCFATYARSALLEHVQRPAGIVRLKTALQGVVLSPSLVLCLPHCNLKYRLPVDIICEPEINLVTLFYCR